MASYASSIFDVLSLGAGLASLYRGEKLHKSTLEHDKELHVRGIASSTEQHFQELCAELLTAAKEADRDVWEQRNGQFNNLMLSSTLMFGVAVASIVEGNFNQTVDGHATAWFALFVACALSFLFVSLVCCMLVSRRMSIYMIMRSSRFVSRLGNIIKTADKIYTDAADAADRIHTGADLAVSRGWRRGGGKGPAVAKIDVREELLRMRWNRNLFQRELMRGLETTTGGIKAVELQAASPGSPRVGQPVSPRGGKSSPFDEGGGAAGGAGVGAGGGAASEGSGGYSVCGSSDSPSELGLSFSPRRWRTSGSTTQTGARSSGEQLQPARSRSSGAGGAGGAGGVGGRGRAAERSDAQHGGEGRGGPDAAGGVLPPKPPEIQLPRQLCRGEGSSSSSPRAEGGSGDEPAGASGASPRLGPSAHRPPCEERGEGSPSRASAGSAHPARQRRASVVARELVASMQHPGLVVKSFDAFWDHHCSQLAQVAFGSFITGTSCVWGAMMTFMWDTYHDSTLAVTIFITICIVCLSVTLAITSVVLAGDRAIVDQEFRDEAKQHAGHASNKHHFSALHLARERSYQRCSLNAAASERAGRSSML